MKRTILFFIALIVGISYSENLVAQFQYTPSDPVVPMDTYLFTPSDNEQLASQGHPYAGNALMDAGKSLTYVGGGLVLSTGFSMLAHTTGVLFDVLDIFTWHGANDIINRETRLDYKVTDFGSVFLCLGSAMVLTGVPMWIVGKTRQESPDGYQYLGRPEGFGMRADLTFSVAPMVGADFVAGYHFNPHFFLGGGVGQRFVDGYMVPIFMDARMTLIDKRIAPYLGADLGYAYYDSVDGFGGFFGLNFGVRIRHKEKDKSRGDWWISSVYEVSDQIARNFGLRVGYSF